MDDSKTPTEVSWRGNRALLAMVMLAAWAAWATFGATVVMRRPWLPIGDAWVWLGFVALGVLAPIAWWNRSALVTVDGDRLVVKPRFGRRLSWPLGEVTALEPRSPTALRLRGPAGRVWRLGGRDVGRIVDLVARASAAPADRA